MSGFSEFFCDFMLRHIWRVHFGWNCCR